MEPSDGGRKQSGLLTAEELLQHLVEEHGAGCTEVVCRLKSAGIERKGEWVQAGAAGGAEEEEGPIRDAETQQRFKKLSGWIQTVIGTNGHRKIKSSKRVIFFQGVSLEHLEARRKSADWGAVRRKLKPTSTSITARKSLISPIAEQAIALRRASNRDSTHHPPPKCDDSAAAVNAELLDYSRSRGCVGLNQDKYATSALVLKLSRGLPSPAIQRAAQSLGVDLRDMDEHASFFPEARCYSTLAPTESLLSVAKKFKLDPLLLLTSNETIFGRRQSLRYADSAAATARRPDPRVFLDGPSTSGPITVSMPVAGGKAGAGKGGRMESSVVKALEVGTLLELKQLDGAEPLFEDETRVHLAYVPSGEQDFQGSSKEDLLPEGWAAWIKLESIGRETSAERRHSASRSPTPPIPFAFSPTPPLPDSLQEQRPPRNISDTPSAVQQNVIEHHHNHLQRGYVDGVQSSGAPSWRQYTTLGGLEYYYNLETDVSQWDPPVGWKLEAESTLPGSIQRLGKPSQVEAAGARSLSASIQEGTRQDAGYNSGYGGSHDSSAAQKFGIGVTFRKDTESGYFEVKALPKDNSNTSPAGLCVGDRLLRADTQSSLRGPFAGDLKNILINDLALIVLAKEENSLILFDVQAKEEDSPVRQVSVYRTYTSTFKEKAVPREAHQDSSSCGDHLQDSPYMQDANDKNQGLSCVQPSVAPQNGERGLKHVEEGVGTSTAVETDSWTQPKDEELGSDKIEEADGAEVELKKGEGKNDKSEKEDDETRKKRVWAEGERSSGAPSWMAYTSGSGRKYYFNVDTNQSQWDPPPGWVVDEVEIVDVVQGSGSIDGKDTASPPERSSFSGSLPEESGCDQRPSGQRLNSVTTLSIAVPDGRIICFVLKKSTMHMTLRDVLQDYPSSIVLSVYTAVKRTLARLNTALGHRFAIPVPTVERLPAPAKHWGQNPDVAAGGLAGIFGAEAKTTGRPRKTDNRATTPRRDSGSGEKIDDTFQSEAARKVAEAVQGASIQTDSNPQALFAGPGLIFSPASLGLPLHYSPPCSQDGFPQFLPVHGGGGAALGSGLWSEGADRMMNMHWFGGHPMMHMSLLSSQAQHFASQQINAWVPASVAAAVESSPDKEKSDLTGIEKNAATNKVTDQSKDADGMKGDMANNEKQKVNSAAGIKIDAPGLVKRKGRPPGSSSKKAAPLLRDRVGRIVVEDGMQRMHGPLFVKMPSKKQKRMSQQGNQRPRDNVQVSSVISGDSPASSTGYSAPACGDSVRESTFACVVAGKGDNNETSHAALDADLASCPPADDAGAENKDLNKAEEKDSEERSMKGSQHMDSVGKVEYEAKIYSVSAAAPGWRQYTSTDGNFYYYHPDLPNTQWEAPDKWFDTPAVDVAELEKAVSKPAGLCQTAAKKRGRPKGCTSKKALEAIKNLPPLLGAAAAGASAPRDSLGRCIVHDGLQRMGQGLNVPKSRKRQRKNSKDTGFSKEALSLPQDGGTAALEVGVNGEVLDEKGQTLSPVNLLMGFVKGSEQEAAVIKSKNKGKGVGKTKKNVNGNAVELHDRVVIRNINAGGHSSHTSPQTMRGGVDGTSHTATAIDPRSESLPEQCSAPDALSANDALDAVAALAESAEAVPGQLQLSDLTSSARVDSDSATHYTTAENAADMMMRVYYQKQAPAAGESSIAGEVDESASTPADAGEPMRLHSDAEPAGNSSEAVVELDASVSVQADAGVPAEMQAHDDRIGTPGVNVCAAGGEVSMAADDGDGGGEGEAGAGGGALKSSEEVGRSRDLGSGSQTLSSLESDEGGGLGFVEAAQEFLRGSWPQEHEAGVGVGQDAGGSTWGSGDVTLFTAGREDSRLNHEVGNDGGDDREQFSAMAAEDGTEESVMGSTPGTLSAQAACGNVQRLAIGPGRSDSTATSSPNATTDSATPVTTLSGGRGAAGTSGRNDGEIGLREGDLAAGVPPTTTLASGTASLGQRKCAKLTSDGLQTQASLDRSHEKANFDQVAKKQKIKHPDTSPAMPFLSLLDDASDKASFAAAVKTGSSLSYAATLESGKLASIKRAQGGLPNVQRGEEIEERSEHVQSIDATSTMEIARTNESSIQEREEQGPTQSYLKQKGASEDEPSDASRQAVGVDDAELPPEAQHALNGGGAQDAAAVAPIVDKSRFPPANLRNDRNKAATWWVGKHVIKHFDSYTLCGRVERVRWDRTRRAPPFDDLFRVKYDDDDEEDLDLNEIRLYYDPTELELQQILGDTRD